IAVAPPSAPLLDLRLLDVGLGEGGIELQRLVETLLGLLRALPAPTGELVESLQVEPLGFRRSGRELRGTPARSGDLGRLQVVEQPQRQLIHRLEELRRMLTANG